MRVPTKYVIYPNATNAQKPCQNYRSKQEPNPVSAIMLKGKQAYQYDACNWNFNICKKHQTFRRKGEGKCMNLRVKETKG